MSKYYILKNKNYIHDEEFNQLILAELCALEILYTKNMNLIEVKDMCANVVTSFTKERFIPISGDYFYTLNKSSNKIEHYIYGDEMESNMERMDNIFKSFLEAKFYKNWIKRCDDFDKKYKL